MLRRLVTLAAALALAVTGLVVAATPVYGSGSGSCQGDSCWFVATGPAVPGTQGGGTGGGTGGGVAQCFVDFHGFEVPVACWDPVMGSFDSTDDCYYKPASPQPPPGDPAWEGHPAGVGQVYDGWCLVPFGGGFGPVRVGTRWFNTPPPGQGNGPTPAQVAARAIAKILVNGPTIGSAPLPTGHGLVGLPVWLWTAQTAGTWGPLPASDTEGGITVTAVANAQYIVWDMGDGHTVTCHNPGSAYGGAGAPSPTCGYRYFAPSRNQPGGVYTVTATTHWLVTWQGGGDQGTLTTDVANTTTIQIDELEVLIS
ncbi:MAG TPA: hypothetical protein VKB59_20295 [Micromonosporaceae bacterium]|nr:hypothetical protein [Micromonosporaceae bacterium]